MNTGLCLAIGLAVVGAPVFGGLMDPRSWAELSADRSLVLVMISTVPIASDNRMPFVLPDGRVVDLRTTFPSTGLYDARTLKPVWTAPLFCFVGEFHSTPDFKSIVIVDTHGLNSQTSLSFIRDGAVVCAYPASELLKHFSSPILLPLTSWDWQIQWYDETEIRGDEFHFTTPPRQFRGLSIGYYEEYVFALSDGRMVSEGVHWGRIPVAICAAMGLLALSIVAIVLAVRAARRRVRQREAA